MTRYWAHTACRYLLRHNTQRRPLLMLAGLLVGMLNLGMAAHGADTSPTPVTSPPIAPFQDEYKLKSSNFPFSIRATRSLKNLQGPLWQMEVLASNFLGEVKELTLFSWQDCLPATTYYGYLRKGLGQRKERQLHIDRKTGIAAVFKDGVEARSYPVPAPVTDKLSQSLALQCMLMQGHTRFALPVADERGVKTYHYEVVGQETLATPLGKLNALHVQRVREPDDPRQTHFWFASDWHYTLLRIEQSDDDEHIELQLEKREKVK